MTAKRSCASGWQYINARQSRYWIITRSARSCTGFQGWALSTTYSAVSCLPSGRTRLRGKLSNFAATQSFNAKQAWSSAFRLQEVRSRLKPELQTSGLGRKRFYFLLVNTGIGGEHLQRLRGYLAAEVVPRIECCYVLRVAEI